MKSGLIKIGAVKHKSLKNTSRLPAKPPVAAEIPKKPSVGMIMLTILVQNS